MTTRTHAGLVDFALRRGDDALVLGQRLCAWTGRAPIVEEDLAMTNVALDLVGQARMWLTFAAEAEGEGRDADALAYLRGAREFRNALIVELPGGDFGTTQLRSFLFDTWHFFVMQATCASSDERIAGIAQKAVREIAYHVRRSSDWVIRLGDGTELSHAKMQAALGELWPYTGELFLPDAVDAEMARAGVGPDLASLREPWRARVADVLAEATLHVPDGAWMHSGGRAGRHTEHLDYVLAEMQSVRRAVPGERW